MLDSLYISNYRNLEELSIDSLGAVNLIIGKNNTGKSSLLEAVGLYATNSNFNFVIQLLEERGENYGEVKDGKSLRNSDDRVKALSSLFTREKFINGKTTIQIGTSSTLVNSDNLTLRIVYFFEEEFNDSLTLTTSKRQRIVDADGQNNGFGYMRGFQISKGNIRSFISLENRVLTQTSNPTFENLQFIRTRHIDREINAKLWDDIILTDKEEYVIKGLKIIEPDIERIAFVEEGFGKRAAVIKLKNDKTVLPLRSMGDGINRVLTIILALVNAVDGYLLIDEFENGLHHSVQEKLWEIIFTLSQKLNIQVFATTHSEDCIAGFEEVLNSHPDKAAGKLIRLENKNGKIVEVEFTANELRIATENNIEIR